MLHEGRPYFQLPLQEALGLAVSCTDVVDVGVPAQVLFDGDAKVLCGVCGLKCVAVEPVGVLQDLSGSGDRQSGALLWMKGHVPALLPLSKPILLRKPVDEVHVVSKAGRTYGLAEGLEVD